MDENIYDELIRRIRKEAALVDGILGTEKCFVRKSGTKYHLDLHAIVDGDIPVKEGHMLAHRLEDHLRSRLPELKRINIHVEPAG